MPGWRSPGTENAADGGDGNIAGIPSKFLHYVFSFFLICRCKNSICNFLIPRAMGVLGVSEFSTSGQLRRVSVIPLSSRCQVQMEDKQVGVDPHLRVPVSLFWAGV